MRSIIQRLLDSADDTGCSEDLTVVGAAELQALRDLASNKYTLTRMERSLCPVCGNNVRLLAEDSLEIAFVICDCGYVGQMGVSPIHHPVRWESDVIQFARLLCEMGALGLPNGIDWEALMENMDLSKEELDSLFERAFTRWEAAKRQV